MCGGPPSRTSPPRTTNRRRGRSRGSKRNTKRWAAMTNREAGTCRTIFSQGLSPTGGGGSGECLGLAAAAGTEADNRRATAKGEMG